MGVACCKCVVLRDEISTQSLEVAAEQAYQAGKYDIALRLYKRAYELQNIVVGSNLHPLKILQQIAVTVEKLGNQQEAQNIHKQIIETKLPAEEEALFDWALSFYSLGRLLCEEEKFQKSLEYLDTALELMKSDSDVNIVQLIKIQIYMGKALLGLARYEEARTILEKCLGRAVKARSEESEEVSLIYEALGELYLILEYDNDEQEEYITINPDGPGTKTLFLQKLIFEVAASKKANLTLERARDYFMKALNIRQRRFGIEYLETYFCQMRVAKVKPIAEAKETAENVIKFLKEKFGEESLEVTWATLQLIKLSSLTIRYDQAKELSKPGLWTLLNKFGEDHYRLADYYRTLGDIAFIQSKYKEAYEDYRKALAISIKYYGDSDPHVAECYESLGICAIKEKKKSDAEQYYNKSLQIKRSCYGPDHPRTRRIEKAVEYWEKFQWVNLADDITERYTKGATSRRTQVDASFTLEEFSDDHRQDDGRFNGKNPLANIRIVGDSSGGSASAKTGCEDALLIMPKFVEDCYFFATIDGHGPDGKTAAEDTRNHLFSYMKKHRDKLTELRNDKAVDSFLRVGLQNAEHVLENNPKVSMNSGCCCLAIFIQRTFLHTVNVGDCKAIMLRVEETGQQTKRRIIDLSKQHRAIREDESLRLSARGAKIETLSKDTVSPRVWQDEHGPGISATRVLGNFKAKKIGVISEPESEVHKLSVDDKFIVAGTDGLWDVMSSKEVVGFVDEFIEKNGLEVAVSTEMNAAQALVSEAKKRWEERNKIKSLGVSDNPKRKSGNDDITVIVAILNFE